MRRGARRIKMPSDPPNSHERLFPAGLNFRVRVGSFEELREAATQWQLEPSQFSPGRYSGLLEACHTARTQLSLARHDCGLRIEGLVPRGTIVLCLPACSPALRMQCRGACIADGDIFAHNSAQGVDFSFSGPIRIFSLAVSRDLLERRAATLWQSDPGSVFGGRLDFASARASLRAREGLARRLHEMLQGPPVPDEPEVAAAREASMLDELLSEVCEPRPTEPSLARRHIARRAAAIIRERCREDLTISDLCAAVRASRRTLHLGFLELYGLGPMTYLKFLRLNGVREELHKRRRDGVNVTSVATSWGFKHLGRFSQYYSSHFGVLPSADVKAHPELSVRVRQPNGSP